jgi:hypothetical protein
MLGVSFLISEVRSHSRIRITEFKVKEIAKLGVSGLDSEVRSPKSELKIPIFYLFRPWIPDSLVPNASGFSDANKLPGRSHFRDLSFFGTVFNLFSTLTILRR